MAHNLDIIHNVETKTLRIDQIIDGKPVNAFNYEVISFRGDTPIVKDIGGSYAGTINANNIGNYYYYTSLDTELKSMPNSWTGCKDYVNDWMYGVSGRKAFDTKVKNGLFFIFAPFMFNEKLWWRTLDRSNLIVKNFLKDIRYEGSEDAFKMICVDDRYRVLYHMEERLCKMPAVISGILMLMRNSHLYDGGSIVNYLTRWQYSNKDRNESSTFKAVIDFIEMFNKSEDINKVFPNDYRVGWAQVIGNTFGIHGGYGIREFMNRNLIKQYKEIYLNLAKGA